MSQKYSTGEKPGDALPIFTFDGLIPIRIQVDIFTGTPFLLLPLWEPFPAIDSPTLNSRTCSAAQTARIGLNAA